MGSACCLRFPRHVLKILSCLTLVQGHGRLIEPPSRSSMWRFGYGTPTNYNDNQLFCGGVGIQYSAAVGGKCGVCGDPWFGPRENEVGGKFATGTIVRVYEAGHVINVTVELTANHRGYFEFRLCQKDDPWQRATWDCMNKHLLPNAGTGETKHPINYYAGYRTKIRLRLRLPANVKCKACVLQWKYNAGNSWGVDKENGMECVGCGNQEQFYACADVAIGYDYGDVIGRSVGCRHVTNNWRRVGHRCDGGANDTRSHSHSGRVVGNLVLSLFYTCFNVLTIFFILK